MIRSNPPAKGCPKCGSALIRKYERSNVGLYTHVGYFCGGECSLFIDPKEYLRI